MFSYYHYEPAEAKYIVSNQALFFAVKYFDGIDNETRTTGHWETQAEANRIDHYVCS